MLVPLTREEVIASSDQLPAFPRVVTQILATLDDPDASLNILAAQIEHDPIIAARVLSLANRAGTNRRIPAAVSDVFTAVSLIGLSQVRQTAVLASLAGFLDGIAPTLGQRNFWEHSVIVGVGCVELAPYSQQPVHRDEALIAGLLHDTGQLWLRRFRGEAYRQARSEGQLRRVGTEVAELAHFAVDHATIGAWLAQGWGLSEPIVRAIARHHDPDGALDEPLVSVLHVAEVLSNALDVSSSEDSRVTSVCAAACEALGLDWGDASQQLFGRIEARSRHAMGFLR